MQLGEFQKFVVGVGLFAFFGMMLFVPWAFDVQVGTTNAIGVHATDYSLIFLPPRGARLDVPRMIIPMVADVVFVVCVVLADVCFGKSKKAE